MYDDYLWYISITIFALLINKNDRSCAESEKSSRKWNKRKSSANLKLNLSHPYQPMQSSQESSLKANLTAPPNSFNLDYAKLRFNMPNLTGIPYDNVTNLNRLSDFVARSMPNTPGSSIGRQLDVSSYPINATRYHLNEGFNGSGHANPFRYPPGSHGGKFSSEVDNRTFLFQKWFLVGIILSFVVYVLLNF